MSELNERRLAHIEVISAIDPIPGADFIERATVLGWHLVVKKDEFKVGDPCVYIEVDSILPEKPEFEFMRERKFRVRTIKLRKQISQGICFPLDILDTYLSKNTSVRLPFGADVTSLLGIKKYDPEGDAERAMDELKKKTLMNRVDTYLRRMPWYRRIFPKKRVGGGNPKLPEFVKKTDEERVQNLSGLYPKWIGQEFSVSEKVDGQSGTYFLVRTKTWFGKPSWRFGICSRNFELPKREKGSYWQFSDQNNMEERLIKFANDLILNCASKPTKTLILQGELAGPGIQENRYGFDKLHFFAFNLIVNGERFTPISFRYWMDMAKNTLGEVEMVPSISSNFELPGSIDDLVNFANAKSVLGNHPREGIVLRSNDGEISFKAISPEFLLHIEKSIK